MRFKLKMELMADSSEMKHERTESHPGISTSQFLQSRSIGGKLFWI